MKWEKLENLPNEFCKGSKKMFVVKGIDVPLKFDGKPYTTDPYCVWVQLNGTLARWPHEFEPTHFCLLPETY